MKETLSINLRSRDTTQRRIGIIIISRIDLPETPPSAPPQQQTHALRNIHSAPQRTPSAPRQSPSRTPARTRSWRPSWPAEPSLAWSRRPLTGDRPSCLAEWARAGARVPRATDPARRSRLLGGCRTREPTPLPEGLLRLLDRPCLPSLYRLTVLLQLRRDLFNPTMVNTYATAICYLFSSGSAAS